MYFDTVVRFIGRTRRYLLTATDHAGRFAVAIAVPRHDSHHAARFAALVQTLFPGRIRQILTDNRLPMYYGSEFQGAFAACARAQGWRHCHTWPRSPKMNAFNERFNRTVQTDFVDYEKDCLLNDLRLFNERLPGFLDRYDGQRPHQGLNYQTPCQMLAQHLASYINPICPICGGIIHTVDLTRRYMLGSYPNGGIRMVLRVLVCRSVRFPNATSTSTCF